MRYIEKGVSPDFFEQEKLTLQQDPSWKNLHCKPALRRHLMYEQKHLCAYCESAIHDSNSHIEHIVAQSEQDALRFDYDNLIVSCNGVQCDRAAQSVYPSEDVHSCGHRKSDELNVSLFLNPVVEIEISCYFNYDATSGAMMATDKNQPKADYTIELLNLDNSRLRNARLNAKAALVASVSEFRKTHKTKTVQEITGFLLNKPPAFVSFLTHCFHV